MDTRVVGSCGEEEGGVGRLRTHCLPSDTQQLQS